MFTASHLPTAKDVNLAPEFTSIMSSNSSISISWAREDLMVARPLSVEVMWENMGDLVTASIR